MLIVLAGGGTGGHVYPALAAAAELMASRDKPDAAPGSAGDRLLFVGSQSGMEQELVGKAGLPFRGVAAAPLLGRSPWRAMVSLARLGTGLIQALFLMRQQAPDVILATGGYVCVPVVLAGWLSGVPSVVYLPDVEPGWAVRFLSRFARRIGVTSPDSLRFLPAAKTAVTGYPVRPELRAAKREEGRRLLGLSPVAKVLLVVGGSRGAHQINAAVAESLPQLVDVAEVVHSCGPSDYEWLNGRRAELRSELARRYHLTSYLHAELAPAMAAADLVVSRAGASVMGEYPARGLPSVLVPYPHAGAHQELNADYLVQRGAAVKIANNNLTGQTLLQTVAALLDDEQRRQAMSLAARQLDHSEAARALADLVQAVGAGRRPLRGKEQP